MNDELERLEQYLSFDEDTGYLLMAIARRKENDHLDNEIVFHELVKDEQDIERKYDKLRAICGGYKNNTTWRIYITINARNCKSAYWNFLDRIQRWAQQLLNGADNHTKFKRVDRNWYSELQKKGASEEGRFIFDLDNEDMEVCQTLVLELREHTEELFVRETPNGWHIVTEPFNYTELESDIEYEVKTDGLLFIESIQTP